MQWIQWVILSIIPIKDQNNQYKKKKKKKSRSQFIYYNPVIFSSLLQVFLSAGKASWALSVQNFQYYCLFLFSKKYNTNCYSKNNTSKILVVNANILN